MKVGSQGEVFLFSGGLDSLVGALYTGCERLLYVRIGHRYQYWEEHVVKELGDLLGIWVEIANGPLLTAYEEPSGHIPGRNLILAFMGAIEHGKVWLALQKGETGLADRNQEFCATLTILFTRLFGRKVLVNSPFWLMDKQDLVQWYLTQGHPEQWLRVSRSCYSTGEQECGDCPACFRKFVALRFNDISCEDWFVVNPRESATAADYRERLNKYPDHRQNAMKVVMEWR